MRTACLHDSDLEGDRHPPALYLEFLAELRLRGFASDITHSHADRTVLATDNPIYQILPQAAVFPRDELDAVRLAKLASDARYREVAFSP